jgi:protein-tyrosine-phosphatase
MNVLFLDIGNSARSILAEAILNARDGRQVRAWSAGSRPVGEVHPLTGEILQTVGMWSVGLRSKHLDEFSRSDSPSMDIMIALCKEAGVESDSVWPGAPKCIRWELPDPAATEGGEQIRLAAFAETFRALDRRIQVLLTLPLQFLSADELQQQLELLAGR